MPTEVRIFRPAKTAMQSGRAKTQDWVMEFEPREGARPDPLIGWNGSADTRRQVRLTFDTLEEAVAHAKRNGFVYTLQAPKERQPKPKAYADNFASGRPIPWTH
jgi:hypothetical protein